MTFKMINGWMFPGYESRLCTVNELGESIYAGLEHIEIALGYVKEFGTAVDIGANVGLISVPLAKKFSKVIAIECIPDTFECLKYNLSSYPNAVVKNFAVSDKLGKIEIAIPTYDGRFISSGWASISKKRQDVFEEKLLLEVETNTIDSLNLNSLDFLKIDVEGAELMVINGAINTIKKFSPVIEFENKRSENIQVLQLLESIGYEMIPEKKRKSSEAIMIRRLL